MSCKNEIIYQADNLIRLEVKVIDETVCLNRQQTSSLFNRDIITKGKYISNVFSKREIDKDSTVAKFATVLKNEYRLFKSNRNIFQPIAMSKIIL